MGYPDTRNPRHVRALLDNAYAGYASGKDILPRVRLGAAFEDMPVKSQKIAALLEMTWADIDEDHAYFSDAVSGSFETLKATGEEDRNGLVVVQIGKNAVGVAGIHMSPEPHVNIDVLSVPEFVEQFEGRQFDLRRGGTVTYADGQMRGSLSGVVVRHEVENGVFGTDPEQTQALMESMGVTPNEVGAGAAE